MRRLHILLWVVAGAFGGVVVTRVWQARQAAAPRTVALVEPAAPATITPLPAIPPPAAAPATAPLPKNPPPAPVQRDSKRAPVHSAHHADALPPARPLHRSPPPAHPRPLELGQAIPPSTPAPQPPAQPQPEPVQVVNISPPPAPEAAPAPEPEPSHTVTLNAGMVIPVRLVDGLSSERSQTGDTFSATLDRELIVEGWVIAERGARVEGRVVAADRGGAATGSTLAVQLTSLRTSDGQTVEIQTDSFERHSAGDGGTNAAKIGGGAIIGAVIGGIAGGGKGAVIGAGAGAGIGAGDVMLTHKPATIPTETRINFRLRTPIRLTEKRG